MKKGLFYEIGKVLFAFDLKSCLWLELKLEPSLGDSLSFLSFKMIRLEFTKIFLIILIISLLSMIIKVGICLSI